MHQSEKVKIEYQGQPALLSVIRNDGYCWGRIERVGAEPLDVSTEDDYYKLSDVDAREIFEEAARDPKNVSPAFGWLEPPLEPATFEALEADEYVEAGDRPGVRS